jgi:hypothetical protein
VCPQNKPFGETSNPITSVPDATKICASAGGITRPKSTLMNDPG